LKTNKLFPGRTHVDDSVVNQNINPRVNDLLKAEEGITELKRMMSIITLISFAMLFGVGVWVGTNNSKLSRLESRLHANDAAFIAMEAKLDNIATILLEIKKEIK